MSILRRQGKANLPSRKALRRNAAPAKAGLRDALANKPELLERLGSWAEHSRKLVVNIAAALTAVLFMYLGWQQLRSVIGTDLVEILPFEMGRRSGQGGHHWCGTGHGSRDPSARTVPPGIRKTRSGDIA